MDAAVAVRWLLYAVLLSLFGLAAFGVYSPAGTVAVRRRVLAAAALAGIAATLAGMLLLIASMSGVAPADVDAATARFVVAETPVGLAGIVRVVALAVALAGALLAPRSAAFAIVAVAAAVACATLAWNGHGAMTEGALGWLHLSADIAHLLAAGLWLGALVALVTLVCRTPVAGHVAAVERALAQFAGLGTAIVAVLVVTGVANAWLILGLPGIATAAERPYGQLMLVKLALFAAMLALAAANRFWLTPRLLVPGRPTPFRGLRISLALETASLVAILAAVAALGKLEP